MLINLKVLMMLMHQNVMRMDLIPVGECGTYRGMRMGRQDTTYRGIKRL